MRKNGVKSCTFEASASALNLQKLDSIRPDCVIYTCTNKNSSEFQTSDYYSCLRRYFYSLENDTKVILNIDDDATDELENSIESYVTYGTSTIADYQIRDIMMSTNGIAFKIVHNDESYPVKAKIQGMFNVYNLTAAIVALHEMGHELTNIINVMFDVPYVDGVMERVDDEYNIIVDCAYDLNSMEEIFKYADFVKHKNKAIGVISINYSDGDKRLERIIELCNQYLDIAILTENESQDSGVNDILERCDKFKQETRFVYISLRSQAIENAIEIMNKDDTLLIVGKGNERFLSMGLGKEFYFGDKHYAKKFIQKRRKEENETI
jgi:UDP-N-acetylmuramyl tripeptide synthase